MEVFLVYAISHDNIVILSRCNNVDELRNALNNIQPLLKRYGHIIIERVR